jgi:hypothetical protein
MGFSGGGSNILKPHTHNGLTVQDGGALDFDDITQSQSSAGMVFFSDGTHLQQLAYPGVPAGETLTATALSTAPSWGTASGTSITVQKISPPGQTTTSTGLTNLTSASATLPSRTGGKAFMVYQQCVEKSTTGHMQQAFYYNGATQESIQTMINFTGQYLTGTNSAIDDLDGGTVQLMWMTNSGTLTLRNSGNQQSYCDLYEVS